MSIYQEILQKIKEYDQIIIHRHVNPDPDAFGSQVGLQKLLQLNFPEKTIKVTGKDEPSLAFLAQMESVQKEDFQGSLAIICDTANTARIDNQDYQLADFVLKIDHHPNDDAYGDLSWVDTAFSSTSEMIAQLAFEQDLKLNADIAYLLFAGIVGDTGRFLYPTTSAQTLEIAGKLRQYPFDFTGLVRKMDSFSLGIAKLQAHVYENLEIDENGAARVVIKQRDLERYGLTDADTAAIVASPGKVQDVQLWGVFVEQKEGHFRVRLRSKVQAINEIAKKHHGGGHPLASGANSFSLAENEEIYQELKNLAKNK